MTTPTPIELLKFANLQMAAEARIDLFPNLRDALIYGNNRSSKFTGTLADTFADQWTVVSHQANTPTGFSGTLFKDKNTGELVMSFRSTEFIDDAARDSEATNKLEIHGGGWAMGQIADMDDWYTSLKASGKLAADAHFSVTGYSLGGHLATAFNLLHQGEGHITSTYTFNGAGVGTVKPGFSLAQVVQDFRQQRNASSESFFQTAQVHDLYMRMRPGLNGHVSSATQQQDLLDLISTRFGAAVGPKATADLDALINAVSNAKSVLDEAMRVQAGIPSGSATSLGAQAVDASQITATQLTAEPATTSFVAWAAATSLEGNSGADQLYGGEGDDRLLCKMSFAHLTWHRHRNAVSAFAKSLSHA